MSGPIFGFLAKPAKTSILADFRVSGQIRRVVPKVPKSATFQDFGKNVDFCDFVDFCGFLQISGNLKKSVLSTLFRTCPEMSKSCDSGHLKLLNFEVPKISTFGTFLDTSFEVSPCVI